MGKETQTHEAHREEEKDMREKSKDVFRVGAKALFSGDKILARVGISENKKWFT